MKLTIKTKEILIVVVFIQDMFQDNPLNEPFMHEFMSDPATEVLRSNLVKVHLGTQ